MANNTAKHAKEDARRVEPSESVVTAPAIEKTPAAPVVVAEPIAKPQTAETGVAGFATFGSSAFDASEWSKKSFDLWNEQATAMADFADGLTKAKTYSDVVSLQSRFVNERLEAMMRQSSEFWTLAQKMMNLSIAPMSGAKTAQ